MTFAGGLQFSGTNQTFADRTLHRRLARRIADVGSGLDGDASIKEPHNYTHRSRGEGFKRNLIAFTIAF